MRIVYPLLSFVLHDVSAFKSPKSMAAKAALSKAVKSVKCKAADHKAKKEKKQHGEVSSHETTFLIQSVREDHAVLIEEYEEKRVASEEFCQASSSFVSAVGTRHEYYEKLETETKKSFTATRDYVQSIEFTTRKDNVRRGLDIREIWESSIVPEVDRIVSVILRQKESASQHGHDVDEVMENKRSDLHEKLPKSGGKFQKKFENEKLESIKSGKAPNGGSEENSNETWNDQKQHYETSVKLLNEIEEIILEKYTSSKKLFSTHISKIVSDSDFELKWPSDFQNLLDEASLATNSVEAMTAVMDEQTVSELVARYITEEGSQGSASAGGHIDKYTGVEALGDAVSLIEAIKESKLETYWNRGETPSRFLAQLTNAFNFLQIRRLGFIDARTAIMKLVVDMQAEMEAIAAQVTAAVSTISTGLRENEEMLVYTYRDAMSFNGVTLDTKMDESDGFQKHLDQLKSSYESGDSLESMVPRISFIVNAARALHRELISFVAAHEGSFSEKVTDFESGELQAFYTNIRTHILSTPETVRNWIDHQKDEGIEQTTAEQLDQEEQLARTTALCLLYGRIDGLEEHRIHENGAQEEILCGPSFAFGEAVSEKIGETYPQEQEAHENKSEAHKGSGPKLAIEHETTETVEEITEHSS